MEIKGEGDLAEFGLYSDLIAIVSFERVELGNFQIFHFSHDAFGLRQRSYDNRLPFVLTPSNDKLILQVIVLDCVENFQAGQGFVYPEISNAVKGSQEREGGGNAIKYGLFQIFCEAPFHSEV